MRKRLSYGARDAEAAISEHDGAVRDAIAAAEVIGPGKPVEEIEAVLVRELQTRRCYMSTADVHLVALGISDPTWALKEPGLLKRLTERAHVEAASETEAADEVDSTVVRLTQALDSLRHIRRSSVVARRTMDGVDYEICIEPWTARRARKIQRTAAPTRITVRPYNANG